jgi:hypothetical protein
MVLVRSLLPKVRSHCHLLACPKPMHAPFPTIIFTSCHDAVAESCSRFAELFTGRKKSPLTIPKIGPRSDMSAAASMASPWPLPAAKTTSATIPTAKKLDTRWGRTTQPLVFSAPACPRPLASHRPRNGFASACPLGGACIVIGRLAGRMGEWANGCGGLTRCVWSCAESMRYMTRIGGASDMHDSSTRLHSIV